jgi:hypothetical protein
VKRRKFKEIRSLEKKDLEKNLREGQNMETKNVGEIPSNERKGD